MQTYPTTNHRSMNNLSVQILLDLYNRRYPLLSKLAVYVFFSNFPIDVSNQLPKLRPLVCCYLMHMKNHLVSLAIDHDRIRFDEIS